MTLIEHIEDQENRGSMAASVTLPISQWFAYLTIMKAQHKALRYVATNRNPNIYICIDKAMAAMKTTRESLGAIELEGKSE